MPGTDRLDLGYSAACTGESANISGVTEFFRHLHRALETKAVDGPLVQLQVG